MTKSYQGRVSAATVMKKTKRALHMLHKTLFKRSPSTKFQSVKLELKRKNKQIRQNELRRTNYRKN